ncbi:hypothetical protein EC991_004792 [Linnemannia zychae]|nr:hypothetical protein EC991_004792 [Linnemannia zychae]
MTPEDNTSDGSTQTVRRVYEQPHFNNANAPSEVIQLVCHFDEETRMAIVLWDDVLSAFKDAIHVRLGNKVLPFLERNFIIIEPRRFASMPEDILDVVVTGPLLRTEAFSADEETTETSPTESLSIDAQQYALRDTAQKNNNARPNSLSTIRRDPQYGLEDVAMDAYRNNDNPAFGQPPRAPQGFPDDDTPVIADPSQPHNCDDMKLTDSDPQVNSNYSDKTPPSEPLSECSFPDPESVEELKHTAKYGDKDAQVRFATMFRDGQGGVPQDYEAAMDWYLKAANQGDDVAQYNLGHMYHNGYGVLEDFKQAMIWYLAAADQGYALAEHNVGFMYSRGEGTDQDFSQAFEWYHKAAEHGLASAQFNVGHCYNNGDGVEENPSQAMEWYLKAAEQGLVEAQFQIGQLYRQGRGVEQDYSAAFEWYLKAADQSDADAQQVIGCFYHDGLSVEQDYKVSLHWFLKAALQGSAMALYNVGLQYELGEGVDEDFGDAMELFVQAADSGFDPAQTKIIQAFPNADGVDQDYEAARETYFKSISIDESED